MTETIAILVSVAACLVAAAAAFRCRRTNQRYRTLLGEFSRAVSDSSSQLESGEIRLRQLMRVVPVGLFEMDLQGRMLHMSQRGRRMLGLSRSHCKGDLWLESVLEADRPRLRGALDAAVGNQAPFTSRCRNAADDRVLDISAELRHDGDECCIGFVGSITDVTERVREEDEGRRIEDRIRQAQKIQSLGVLAGGIAHDFNNLLVGILGNASLVLEDLPPGPSRVAVDQIQGAALRAADLADQMLAYSGKGKFVVQPLDLNALIKASGQILDITTDKQGTLEYQLAEEPLPTEADATQVRQVLMNLVTNASESYGPRSGKVIVRSGTTEVSEEVTENTYSDGPLPTGTYVFLEVEDQGEGMDARTQDRLFDPFFTTRFTGRGLGLAATLGIVRGHHGAIQMESHPGVGTKMRVLLPITARPVLQPPRRLDHAPSVANTATVLIVDDEETVLDMASRMLRARNFTVLTAPDGPAALSLLETNSAEITVVLLDMVMPGMNGHEVLAAMRDLDPRVRVVMTSGYSETHVKEGLDHEISGFIQKPYRPAALESVLLEAIQATGDEPLGSSVSGQPAGRTDGAA